MGVLKSSVNEGRTKKGEMGGLHVHECKSFVR
jgi:hypothetical protein